MKICPSCGNAVDDSKTYCNYCGIPLYSESENDRYIGQNRNQSDEETTELNDSEEPQFDQPQFDQPQFDQPQFDRPQFDRPQFNRAPHNNQYQAPTPYTQPQGVYPQKPKRKNSGLIITICVLAAILLVMICVGVYLHTKDSDVTQDPEPRPLNELNIVNGGQAYVVSRLKLRSEPSLSNPYNVLTVLPVGTALNVIDANGAWSRVSVIGPSYAGLTGWVATRYIVSASDYAILNSIFTDRKAHDAFKESYMQYALLQYYHMMNYVGRISDQQLSMVGLNDFKRTNDNQWQVEVTTLPPAPSEIRMQKLIDPTATIDDLAVIIKNINTGQRRLLYFTFDKDENATLYRDITSIPSRGRIQNINRKANGDLEIFLTEN